jgi:Type IV secretion system pilin
LASVGLVDLLRKVEEDLAALRRSGALDDALRRWQTRREELQAFADASALIRFVRDPDVEPRRVKDVALAALCVEATHGDQSAVTLLVWLMLPGLLRVRRRLASWNALDRDDLDAELLAGVWEAAAAIEPVTANVAARLLDRARRRALAAIRQAADWAGRTERLTQDVEESTGAEAGASDVDGVLAEAVRAGVISAVEADLFRVSRTTVRELRSRLGVTESAVRNRRRRAKRRLLAWLATTSLISPQFLLPRTPQGIPPIPPPPPTRNGGRDGLCRGAGVARRATRRGTGHTHERRRPPSAPVPRPGPAEGRWHAPKRSMRLAQILAADPGMDRIVSILDGLRNALVAVLVTLSVVALTYAGVRYVIAGGDATGVEKAKGAAKSAVIGLTLALLAPVVVSIVKRIIGG